jgi:curved DNA-binding protein CbpA
VSAPEGGRALARTLASCSITRASGIVTATRGRLKRLFCLEEGRLVHAASNVVEEQFVEYLVREGHLGAADREAAEKEAARSGRKLPVLLRDSGGIPLETLQNALASHVQALLEATLEWPDGSHAFQEGRPRLDGEFIVDLSPIRLILSHAGRYPPRTGGLRVRIGPPDMRPVRTALGERLPAETGLDAVSEAVLRLADCQRRLSELVAEASTDEEAALRAVHAMVLVGALEPAAGPRAGDSRSGQRELSREECAARAALAEGTDSYAVLSVGRGASAEEIRAAYYNLARRYHPDRFRSGSLQDLLTRMELYFARVTEAYNTLSDPERRARYDEQLAVTSTPGPGRISETAHLARQNFLRGREAMARRRLTEAATFFENAVKLDDRQAAYHLELGSLLTGNPRRREEAARHLLRASEIDPTNPAAYVALGRLYAKLGDATEAARRYREALRWDPTYADAVSALAALGEAS